MTDLQTIRKDIERRIRELEPLVEEHAELRQALVAIDGERGPERTRSRKPAGARKRSGASDSKALASEQRRRPGRPRKTKADRFLDLVRKQPGITAADAAKRLKTAVPYVYKLAASQIEAGAIRKEGKGFVPASAPKQAARSKVSARKPSAKRRSAAPAKAEPKA